MLLPNSLPFTPSHFLSSTFTPSGIHGTHRFPNPQWKPHIWGNKYLYLRKKQQQKNGCTAHDNVWTQIQNSDPFGGDTRNFQTVHFVQQWFNISLDFFFFTTKKKKQQQPLFRYVCIDILFSHENGLFMLKGSRQIM